MSGAGGARLFTRAEVSSRAARGDAVLIIDNVVYGVAEWLDHHPGGADVLLAAAGGDASQCFHDVGHSADARAWRERFALGALVPAERRAPAAGPAAGRAAGSAPLTPAAVARAAAPPLLLAAAAALLHAYLFR